MSYFTMSNATYNHQNSIILASHTVPRTMFYCLLTHSLVILHSCFSIVKLSHHHRFESSTFTSVMNILGIQIPLAMPVTVSC